MSKHTPGPWRLHASADVEPFHIGISAKEHELIAQVVVQMDGDELQSPQLVANARLIAAAPELLEAAQWCIALCEEIGATETNAYAQARAAISKATGEAA